MKSKLDLQEDKVFALKSCEEIVSVAKNESRSLNADEKARFESKKRDISFIDSQLDGIRENEERDSYIATEMAKSRAPEARRVSPTQPSNEPSVFAEAKDMKNSLWTPNNLRAFPNDNEGRKLAYQTGKWFQATVWNDASALRYCRDNGIESRSMSEGTATAGGYTVPVITEGPIIKIRNEAGVMVPYVNIRTMPNDTLNVPWQTTPISAVVTAEGTALTNSQPVYAQLQLVAQKVGAVTAFSTELNEDSIVSVGDEIAFELGYAHGIFFDTAIWNGTGSSTFGNITGIANVLATSHAASIVSASTGHVSFATLTVADITNALAALPAYAQAGGAKIYCSNYVYNAVFLRLAASGGGNNMLSYSQSLGKNWLGIPIVTCEVLPGLSASATVSQPVFYYGSIDQSIAVGQRRGITVAKSVEVGFLSELVYIKSTQRLAMAPKNLGTNSVTGSMVALTTSAS